MKKLFIISVALLATFLQLYAQDDMEVFRGNAVDYRAHIQNIHIDEDNNKWVGTRNSLFQVHAADLSTRIELAPGEESLLRLPNGNADIRWTVEALEAITGPIFDDDNTVTSGQYDKSRKELWLGTSLFGLYQFKVEPRLELIEQYTIYNSKLKSDEINCIYLDAAARQWVGTEDGILFGDKGRWQLLERDYAFKAIAGKGLEIWLMTEDELGPLDARQRWAPIEIPRFKTEGSLLDITFDDKGNLWIASEIITRYNPESGEFTVFGPAQEFTSQFATCLAADQDNAIWVGSKDKGLYIIDKASAMTVTALVDKELTCNGNGKDAALRVEVFGGQEPYNYKWTGGLSGEQPQYLAPGEYVVTVTDAKGKSKAAKAIITDPRVQASIIQQQPESGPEAADAVATVNATGGTPGYTYQWDNGEATQTASQLAVGEHSVTVTDKAGCSTTASLNITQELAALAVNIEPTEGIDCNGGAGAALQAVVSGGKEPYQYQWSQPGFEGTSASGLAAGNIQLTVTDAVGNVQSTQFIIEQPEAIQATAMAEIPASTGNADGQASVSATGGSTSYTYKWDNGEATQMATKLSPGTHTVTVTDGKGCSTTASVEISEDILPLTVSIEQTVEVDCFGEQGAALQAKVRGGKGPFQYRWSEAGISGENVSDLAAGDYQLTVTDAAGNTQSAQFSVPQPIAIAATATADAPASTGNADGQASVSASGGSTSYTYKWDNGEATQIATQLAPGTHTVTVTDGNGCSTTASVEVSEDILPLTVSIQQTAEVNCFGEKGAALQAQARGGKGPFQYQWSDSSINGDQAAALTAGEYQLTVTDAVGTSQSTQFSVPQPTALAATAIVDAPASTGNADGQASVSASGGDGNYTYRWDNGEQGANVSTLAPGTHTVTVTDGKGCSTTASVDISEDILPLTVSIQQTAEVNCFGEQGAALQAQVRGGKGPFQYQWSDSSINGNQASALTAGEYQLTVTDAVGTSQSTQFSVPQPTAIAATATAEAPASTGNADGQASVSASGGDGNYTYRWDNGEQGANVSTLAPGTHTVTITDGNGCSTTASVDISEDILPLTVSIQQTAEVNCFGEQGAALQAQARGGKGPFQYQWSDSSINGNQAAALTAGEYQLTVIDAVGTSQSTQFSVPQPTAIAATATVDAPASTGNADGQASVSASGGDGSYSYRWDNGEQGANATTLAPGTHTVTVTDGNGCSNTANVEVSENILPLTVSIQQTAEVNCFGEQGAALQVQVRGGKGPFQYQWSDSSINGNQASALTAGEYQLTVTDAVGTSQSTQFSVPQPTAIAATATVDAPASTGNADGQASVSASGGDGSYSYRWDNGEEGIKASTLAPGTHTVTVTDGNGCSTTASVEISENILPLTVSIQQTAEVNCFGEQGAALQAQVRGGKGPFQYQWSDSNINGNQASALTAGEYQLTVTDAVGTSQSTQFSVPQPTAIAATATVDAPASTGNADGQASVSASGGDGSYSYRWDNGEQGANATTLAPGTHTVTVTDGKGCTSTANVEISENILPLTVSIQQTAEVNCFGEQGAALQAQVKGGKGPFQYQWSDSSINGNQAAALTAGEYQLTVTDVVGTSQSAAVSVSQPEALTAKVEVIAPASTNNSDGQAKLSPTGGTAPYTYRWDNGETAAIAKALAPGSHSATITDARGCTTTTAAVEISENILPLSTSLEQTNPVQCYGDNTAALKVMVRGGKGPFRYEWNTSAIVGAEGTGLVAGDYEVTVTDAEGSTEVARLSIGQPKELTIQLVNKEPAFSESSEDGKATAQAQGGNGSYTYKWDNGATAATVENLGIGFHSVTVTDSKGCTASSTFETTERIMKELASGAVRSGQTIQMQKLQFEADSTNIQESAKPILDEIYVFLKDNPSIIVEIGGHTNNLPPPEYCDELSTARARAVAEYLVQEGIDPDRVFYKGYGKRKPLFSNATEDGRRRNQRVEIKILRL